MTEFPDARNAQGDNPGTIAPILLSQLGEGIKECELLSWHVAVGDKVEAFHPLCDVQSDKATVEITSRFTGCVTALRHQPGDMIQVGEVLANIQLAEGSSGNAAASVTRVQAPSSSEPPTKKHNPGQVGSPRHVVLASPVVRRMAKDNNLDLAVIRGTGPDGRIVKADVLALAEGSTLVESPARPSAPQVGKGTAG